MKPAFFPTNLSRDALTEWLIFGTVVIALTLPFWLTDLDIQAAAAFYHPDEPQNFWTEENNPLWVFFYRAIPIFVNILLLGALAVLALVGSRPDAPKIRRMALFVLFSIILGPGLVVNGVFKDHYGRPRPRQIEQFQGHLTYQPPGLPGAEGKSFPCGHCSVGFVVWVFYFLYRRKKPLVAAGILLVAVVFGVLVGLGRMAAGGHFLSDVLWSGFLSYAVCALLYRPLVGRWENTPDDEVPEFALLASWQTLSKPSQQAVLVGLAVFVTVVASLATPVKTQTDLEIPLDGLSPQRILQIEAQVGDVMLRRSPKNLNVIKARLRFKGFGFPISRIKGDYTPADALLSVSKSGLFTDIEGQLELILPVQYAQPLSVKAAAGSIFLATPQAAHWELDAAKGVFLEHPNAKHSR